MIVKLYGKTDVGRIRAGNEDNFLVLDLAAAKAWTAGDGTQTPVELRQIDVGEQGVVLIVSDGMGGALAGDVASRMAVETVRDMLLGNDQSDCTADGATPLIECLSNATEYANFAIHRCSQEDARYAGMGTTLTGAAITGDTLDFIQVGDSRAYVLRESQIKLTTKDQSLVQQLVDVGQISEQEAETHMFRNVILQALGAQSELTPVTGRMSVCHGDILLLCSDGLSGKLRADDILRVVLENREDLAAACEELVAEANRRGGEDNITVIIAEFSGDDLAQPDSRTIVVEMPSVVGKSTLDFDDTAENPRVK